MGATPDWVSITLADLFPAISNKLEAQLESLDAGAKALLETNENIRDAVNQKIDELNDLIDSVNEGLQSIKENLDSTGVFLLVIRPQDISDTGGTTGFITKLQNSIDDEDDPKRPQFNNTAFTAGVVMLVGSPSLDEVNNFVDKLTAFITVDPINLPVLDKLTAI